MSGYYDDDNDDDDNSSEEVWPFEGAEDYFETPQEAWSAFNEYNGEDADNGYNDYY